MTLRERGPVREMGVVSDADGTAGELDIYLALDDFIASDQICKLMEELRAMINHDGAMVNYCEPRISTELIHI